MSPTATAAVAVTKISVSQTNAFRSSFSKAVLGIVEKSFQEN